MSNSCRRQTDDRTTASPAMFCWRSCYVASFRMVDECAPEHSTSRHHIVGVSTLQLHPLHPAPSHLQTRETIPYISNIEAIKPLYTAPPWATIRAQVRLKVSWKKLRRRWMILILPIRKFMMDIWIWMDGWMDGWILMYNNMTILMHYLSHHIHLFTILTPSHHYYYYILLLLLLLSVILYYATQRCVHQISRGIQNCEFGPQGINRTVRPWCQSVGFVQGE